MLAAHTLLAAGSATSRARHALPRSLRTTALKCKNHAGAMLRGGQRRPTARIQGRAYIVSRTSDRAWTGVIGGLIMWSTNGRAFPTSTSGCCLGSLMLQYANGRIGTVRCSTTTTAAA